MRARGVQHRMPAARREARRDPRLELQRRAQEEAAQRAPLLVVVGGLAARHREPDGAQHAPVVAELGRADVAVARRAALARVLVERHRVGVAGLQIGIEVDLAREDVRERHGQLRALARPGHRLKERRRLPVDTPRRGGALERLRNRHHRRCQRRGPGPRRRDPQEAIAVDLVLEKTDGAFERPLDRERLQGAQPARVEHVARRVHDAEHRVVRHAVTAQQRIEGGAAGHQPRDERGVGGERNVAAGRAEAGSRIVGDRRRTGGQASGEHAARGHAERRAPCCPLPRCSHHRFGSIDAVTGAAAGHYPLFDRAGRRNSAAWAATLPQWAGSHVAGR